MIVNPEIYIGWSLGSDYSGSDNSQSAETWTASIKQSPNNAGNYINRGNLYKKIGAKEKALSDNSEAIRRATEQSRFI